MNYNNNTTTVTMAMTAIATTATTIATSITTLTKLTDNKVRANLSCFLFLYRVNDIRALPTQSSMVASVSDDGQIKIWDLNTNQMIDSWEVDPVSGCAVDVCYLHYWYSCNLRTYIVHT